MKYLNLSIAIYLLVFASCKKSDSDEESSTSSSVVKEFSIREGGDKQIYFDFDKETQLSIDTTSSKYGNFSLIEGEYQTTSGGTVNVTKNLPQKDILDGWEIVFTKYTDVLKMGSINYKYELTGVLSNIDNGVEVLRINDDKYESIVLDSIKSETFSNEYSSIGSDWKKLESGTSTPAVYSIVDNLYFVIKTDTGNYYKLRFLNFHTKGITGNVQVEYQKL